MEVAQQQRGHLQNALLASFDSRGCRILKNQLGQLCDDGSRHHPTNKAEIHNCVLPLNGMRRSWSMDKVRTSDILTKIRVLRPYFPC